MIADLYTKPRPVPGRLAPMLAGTALIVLALALGQLLDESRRRDGAPRP